MITATRLVGTLMGQRSLPEGGRRQIVGVSEEQRPQGGPAANSMVSVVTTADGESIAGYVSWINYFDLDQISGAEPAVWTLVEPGDPFEADVVWDPYTELTGSGEAVVRPGPAASRLADRG